MLVMKPMFLCVLVIKHKNKDMYLAKGWQFTDLLQTVKEFAKLIQYIVKIGPKTIHKSLNYAPKKYRKMSKYTLNSTVATHHPHQGSRKCRFFGSEPIFVFLNRF